MSRTNLRHRKRRSCKAKDDSQVQAAIFSRGDPGVPAGKPVLRRSSAPSTTALFQKFIVLHPFSQIKTELRPNPDQLTFLRMASLVRITHWAKLQALQVAKLQQLGSHPVAISRAFQINLKIIRNRHGAHTSARDHWLAARIAPSKTRSPQCPKSAPINRSCLPTAKS